MSALPRTLGALGVAVMPVGLGWAYATRGRGELVPLGLVVAGAVLLVLAALAHRRAQLEPEDLVRPVGLAEPLPGPAWWPAALAAGAGMLTGGPVAGGTAGGWVGVAGAVLIALAAIGAGRDLQRPPATLDRRTLRTARALRAFAARHAVPHGETGAEGVLEPVGRGVTRLVVVGADGTVADAVLRAERAALAAALAGVALHETFPPELGARLETGPSRWHRMGRSRRGSRRLVGRGMARGAGLGRR